MDKFHAQQCMDQNMPILCTEREYHRDIRSWLVDQLVQSPDKQAYVRAQLASLDAQYGDASLVRPLSGAVTGGET
jgi:hypothetical protein